jgi:pSer/pThr/pTyr-binding forkhead associated (FHA) protein
MRALLVSLDGGSNIEITKDVVVVGRREDCDLFLDHKSVSKLHCVLAKTDNMLLLRDLGSTNGTRVNGQRVRRAALLANDQLHVASLHYKVQFVEDAFAAHADEMTQQIDNSELLEALAKIKGGTLRDDQDSEPDLPAQVVRTNTLPDVIEEPAGKDDKPAK